MTSEEFAGYLSHLHISDNRLLINGKPEWAVELPQNFSASIVEEKVYQACASFNLDYIGTDTVRNRVYEAMHNYEPQMNVQVQKQFSNVTGNQEGAELANVQGTDSIVTHDLLKLTKIDDPSYAGQMVRVKAVIASNTTSYNVPKLLTVECSTTHEESRKCPRQKVITLSPADIARYGDSKNREELNRRIAKSAFLDGCFLSIKETSDTLFRVRVRPYVTSLLFQDGKFTDESGVEYKHYDIFLQGRHDLLEPGSVYQVTGTVIPDPKSQKVTLFATVLAKDASSEYGLEKIVELKQLLAAMPTVEKRVEWIRHNFQKYSQVRKREDVIISSFLVSFSPLWISFDGKTERGWLNGLIVGDSTTGKSETVKRMIRLLGGGQLVVAETSSIVGLSATATQTQHGWFVEWGPLVLQDMRLLAVDGAQKLSRQEWSTLAEAIRLGTIKLTKAARGEANARTRQILIANPVDIETRGTKEMDAFLYPYLSLPSILDPVNIARLDLAVFVNAGDVKVDDINKTMDEGYDPLLHNLKDLRAFVWQNKYTVQYEQGFVEAVHSEATNLYNAYYVKAVPLLSIDLKFKLVRLSTALALGTCSFNEGLDTVNVTKEHVEYVVKFLKEIYEKAGFGTVSRREKDRAIDAGQLATVVETIRDKTGLEEAEVKEILLWLGAQTNFTKELLQSKFELAEKAELRPLLTTLQSEELIRRRSGFIPTSRCVQAAKLLIELGGLNV
jgi:hypothetical protein